MVDRKKDWDTFAEQAEWASGLQLPEEARPQVIGHFSILADHAARIMALEIDDEVELAPVFRP